MRDIVSQVQTLKKSGQPGRFAGIIYEEILSAAQALDIKHNTLLWVLLFGDLLLITIYVLHRIDFYFLHTLIPFLEYPRHSLTMEWGNSEVYQYCKELGSAALLSAIAVKRRQQGFFVWSLLFFYLFLDDSMQLHETLGAVVTDFWALHPLPGIEGDGLGQATISAVVGAIFISGLVAAYWRGSKSFRSYCVQMAIVISALAFCGIALDMIDIEKQSIWVKGIVTIFEDGGEMIVMSFALALVVAWYREKG